MSRMKTMKTKYLIIGNSAGGIGGAEAIREIDKVGSITIVSDELYPAYSRPLIAKYLAKECSEEKILFRPVDFYDQNNIACLLGRKVKRLRLESGIAELEGGERIAWEKLLIASGGVPIVPKIEEMDKKGVFTFTTLDDAKAIDGFLENAKRAVVIGGGLVGISVTEALVKRGVEITVVEVRSQILRAILDKAASLVAEETFRQAGVRIIGGHTVAEIVSRHLVEGVILDNGEEVPANLVVVAMGASPRTELVIDTGIKVNRGIVVDRYMATNYPGIYACGDVAEVYDFIYGINQLIPIWLNAYLGGRIAGFNMAGIKTEYPGGTTMNSLNYFGLDIASAGMVTPPDDSNYEVISKQKDGIYKKVILKDDLVVGMVFVGDIEKSGIVFNLMREQVNVTSFKEELIDDDFSLASLPRELWQKRLGLLPSEVEKAFVGEGVIGLGVKNEKCDRDKQSLF